MKMLSLARHWFWVAPVVVGLVFVVAGLYMLSEGNEAKDEVQDALVSENIITSEDAAIPNVVVDDADTAKAQSDVIKQHTLELTGGETYSTIDRYVAADGESTTNNRDEALLVEGNPVPNPVRNTAFQSAALRTSLNLAVMGFKVSELVMGMGVAFIVLGVMNILFLAPAVYWAAEVANERGAVRPAASQEDLPGTTATQS
jgi:hypothetical protein